MKKRFATCCLQGKAKDIKLMRKAKDKRNSKFVMPSHSGDKND